MSLNWVQVTAPPLALVPLPGEKLVYELESADVQLDVPPTPDGPKWSATATGKVWITNQRFVFAAPSAVAAAAADAPPAAHPPVTPSREERSDAGMAAGASLVETAASYISSFLPSTSSLAKQNPPLHSLSIPLPSLAQPTFAQPLFGANAIHLAFPPTPGGGLPAFSGVVLQARVYAGEGRLFEAYERLGRARERAGAGSAGRRTEVEDLPAYPGRS